MSALDYPTIRVTAPSGIVHASDWSGDRWLTTPIYDTTVCGQTIKFADPRWHETRGDMTCRRCLAKVAKRETPSGSGSDDWPGVQHEARHEARLAEEA